MTGVVRRSLLKGSLSWLVGAPLAISCGGADRARSVPTITVEKRRFVRTVDADGHLKPVQATALTAPRSPAGPMRIAWLAEDGSTVKKGDVVARFDDLELRTQLQGAQDERTIAAQKKLKENLLVAQGRNDRKRTTEAALRELEMGQAFQRKDTEIYSRDDIITAEIDGKLQSARAEHARKAQSVDGQVARRKLQILEVEAKKAEEAFARAEKGLQMLELRAPHDGVLVFRRNWRGETLGVGDQAWGTLAEVSRSDEMEAEVFVLEVEAAGLAKGKKAEIVLESLPHRTWKGEVKRVESVAKRRNPRSPTQYFGVTLSLAKTDAGSMKPGQRIRAKLELDVADTLVLPRPALFQKDGQWVAYRRAGDGFTTVPVKVGASTAGLVAVQSGLAAGDVVALRDPGQSLDEILSGGAPTAAPPSKTR